MLQALHVRGFKSLKDSERVELAPLTVLFGPNAAGKSNSLDAVQVLSRLATERTVAEALTGPVRGLPLESFTFPPAGLPGLLAHESASLDMEADLARDDDHYRYRVEISIAPSSGALTVADEYLARLGPRGQPIGNPVIERHLPTQRIRVRRKSKPAHPWEEPVGLNHTLLSNPRYSGREYRVLERAREEMRSWRTYYLDPRVAMRSPQPPQEVTDIGPLGDYLAPYLYRLRVEHRRVFDAIRRTLRTLVPSVEDLAVDLDPRRGVLDVEVRQDGTPFSSRIVSEGTLRVLALACVAANPWGGSVVAFEEPENGVHPRRIEMIAQMLAALATGPRPRQFIVTTHSPLFCGAVIRLARAQAGAIRMYRVVRSGPRSRLVPFEPTGPLFADREVARALEEPSEEAVFQGLALRGLFDA